MQEKLNPQGLVNGSTENLPSNDPWWAIAIYGRQIGLAILIFRKLHNDKSLCK